MYLRQYFHSQYVPTRQLREKSIYQHDRSLRLFCETVGHEPRLCQVTPELIARAVQQLRDSHGDKARKRVRDCVVTTLKHAIRYGKCCPIGYVDTVRVRPKAPEAWTKQQILRLLECTAQLGRHDAWFNAFIRTGWDTGLRKSDIEGLERPTNLLVVYQEKTDEPILVKLRQSTVEAIGRLKGKRPLRWYHSESQVYYWWEKLCRIAGVPYGSAQRLRRSAATNVELHHPGAATQFLGHRSADLARRHYLDPRILQRSLYQPEEL